MIFVVPDALVVDMKANYPGVRVIGIGDTYLPVPKTPDLFFYDEYPEVMDVKHCPGIDREFIIQAQRELYDFLNTSPTQGLEIREKKGGHVKQPKPHHHLIQQASLSPRKRRR
jgi:hypothetical protein